MLHKSLCPDSSVCFSSVAHQIKHGHGYGSQGGTACWSSDNYVVTSSNSISSGLLSEYATLLHDRRQEANRVYTARRLSAIANWKELPIPGWLIVAIYADSMVFVLSTAVLEKGFNLNNNYRICDAASILCK